MPRQCSSGKGNAAAGPIPTHACAPGSSHADPSGSKRSARVRSGCARETYSRQDRSSSGGLYHLVTTYCVSSSCTAIGYLPRRANQERKLQESLLHRTNGKNHYCIASTGGDLGSHGGAQARGAHTGGSSCARVRKCGYGGHSNAYETRAKPKSQIITSQFSFTSCMQSSVHSVPGLGHALPGNG